MTWSWELMHAAVTSVEEKKRIAENNGEAGMVTESWKMMAE
jgi:hypothetical protein